jgi:hypothetical protein
MTLAACRLASDAVRQVHHWIGTTMVNDYLLGDGDTRYSALP